MIRTSTFALHEHQLFNANRTQTRMQDTTIQISSGKQSQDYAGLADQSRRLVSLESSHMRSENFLKQIDMIGSRLTTMETSISQLQDIASSLKTLLVNATSGDNASDLALADNGQAMLDQFAGLLNVQEDGRYLFAGGKTDTKPVDLGSFDPTAAGYDPTDPTTANSGYYAGDDLQQSVRVDEDQTVTYGITANESGFEALGRALYLTKTANGDKTQLEQALQAVNDAIDQLPDVRSRVGADQNALDSAKTRHNDLMSYTEQSIGDIENVDVASAMTQFSADQVMLEASYSVTAKLSQISLVNFLK
ncbi:flagellar hook-associated protein 3 FlgL [Tistlia consotensis]|uniref:Flagellin n=1 Tax=Tistlia consotensis USBA 355 TaxID=560819 RepID=A0A1Y6CK32_9PROT|nr:flagellin [Tistlia consotensis]SMF67842.1 flagellar hook-associated protein 3 FlgL [Tistlia consotensis USBA 355]SNR99451.1 flagellar hook-associated protein 3 FlgL [Tistlia consotensis]